MTYRSASFGILFSLIALVIVAVECNENPTKSKAEPTPSDSLPKLVGMYTGVAVTDNFVLNTRSTIYATLTIGTSTGVQLSCPDSIVFSIGETGTGSMSTYGLTGTPGRLTWDCSTPAVRIHIDAEGDGMNFAGVIDQWLVHDPDSETHHFSMSFRVAH